MKTYLITMAGTPQGKSRWTAEGVTRSYTKEAERLMQSSQKYHFDARITYTNDDIFKSDCYKDHKQVLDAPSFSWAFKPLLIAETLDHADWNDVVIWTDSNHIVVGDPQPLIDFAKENNIFCHDHAPHRYTNAQFTHRDTFVNMKCDGERYWNGVHLQVSTMAFCKTMFTVSFVREWLKCALNINIISNNVLPNFPEYIDHRHEQSIFSILAEECHLKYGHNPQHIFYEGDIIGQ